MCKNVYCNTPAPDNERCKRCQEAWDDGNCANSTCGIGGSKRTAGKKDGFCSQCRTLFQKNKQTQGLRQCRAIEVESPNQGQPCTGYAVKGRKDGYCQHHHEFLPSFLARHHYYLSKGY